MATRLKNLRLTSVDMVRNGANQEADICLFKSTDPEEDPVQPTAAEKNIFKRFINWMRENHADAPQDDEDTVEKDYTTFDSLTAARENNEKLWQYTNALTESIRSIQMDQDLDKDQKYQLMAQSLDQFDEAMDQLIEALCEAAPPAGLAKSDPEEEEDEAEWDDDPEDEDVEKFNHNHDSLGRFASGGGGGGGGVSGSDVRSFGVPGTSSSYHMNKKERKLAQTIIDNEELDLKIEDGKDAYGNLSTSFRGTREDYGTFKEMWNMVAPSELGKSADFDEIEEV